MLILFFTSLPDYVKYIMIPTHLDYCLSYLVNYFSLTPHCMGRLHPCLQVPTDKPIDLSSSTIDL